MFLEFGVSIINFDTARMRHANRMFNSGDSILTKSDLVTIQVEDIKDSSLFTELNE